jgi:hypothetical protein
MTDSEVLEKICAYNSDWKRSWKKSGFLNYGTIAEIGAELIEYVAKGTNIQVVKVVFEDIEQMLDEASIETRSLIGAGMFEAMQTHALSIFKPKQMDAMDEFFGPLSLKLWQDLIEDWHVKGIRSLKQLDHRIRKSVLLSFGDFQLSNYCMDGLVEHLWGEQAAFDSEIHPEHHGAYMQWYHLTNRNNQEFVRINWVENVYQLEASTKKLRDRTIRFLQKAYDQIAETHQNPELTYYAYRGDLEKVKAYCKKDCDFYLPMIRSAEEGALDVFRFLLKKQNMQPKELGKTLGDAFVAACGENKRYGGRMNIIRFILKHRDKMSKRRWNNSLAKAITASAYTDLELLKFLLKGRKKLPLHSNPSFETPIHRAAASGNIEIMKELLQMRGAKQAWSWQYEANPRERAFAYNRHEMVAFLDEITAGWDWNNLDD